MSSFIYNYGGHPPFDQYILNTTCVCSFVVSWHSNGSFLMLSRTLPLSLAKLTAEFVNYHWILFVLKKKDIFIILTEGSRSGASCSNWTSSLKAEPCLVWAEWSPGGATGTSLWSSKSLIRYLQHEIIRSWAWRNLFSWMSLKW